MKTAIAFFLMLVAAIPAVDSHACACQDGDQWHHGVIQSHFAWDLFTGNQEIPVAFLGTGVDLDGLDFNGNLWVNPGEIAGNNIDDDGNGYVDDINGWDFANNQPVPQDYFGFGTQMSGIMAAEGPTWSYRGMGVTHKCRIMSLKISNDIGGLLQWHVDAFKYARKKGAKIIFSYLQHSDDYAPLRAEVDSCTAAGVLIVNGVGGSVSLLGYPALYDSPALLTVSTSTIDRTQGEMLGPDFVGSNVSVDLVAPVARTNFVTGPNGRLRTVNLDESWSQVTSWFYYPFAAAQVAGAAALVWGAFPNLTAAQVKGYIMDNVDVLPAFSGLTVTGGRLNVYKALNAAFGGEIESAPVNPQAANTGNPPSLVDDGRLYDVMGRRVEPGYRGVAFTKSRKRVVVMP